MTTPAFLFGLLVSTLIGAAFHLLLGGGLGRLLLYLILGWIGFWGGHILAAYLDWTFGNVGPLNLGLAIFSSLVVLFVGHWLSKVEVERR
jgi:hypothetical protein